MMRSRAAWAWLSVACLFFAACAEDDEPDTDLEAPDNGSEPNDRDDPKDVDLGGKSGGSTAQPGGKPSGATFRLVNLYVPGNDDPGPVDAYGLAWSTPADKPLVTVPYGEVSEAFDPKMFGDSGDAFLSTYWPGTSGNGNALISVTATLKPGDATTYILTPGSNKQASGRRYGAMQSFDHKESVVPFGVEEPPAGQAFLIVNSVGLDEVLDAPDDVSLFFSIGSGCLKALGDQDFSLTSVGPGTSGTYALDPGAYTGSIHAYVPDDQNERTCDNEPILGDIAFEVEADQISVLKIYAPEDGDYRSLFIPLED